MDKEMVISKIQDILGTETDENTSKENCEQWDSLNSIRIIMMLQNDFGVSVKAKDIDRLNSVKDILALV